MSESRGGLQADEGSGVLETSIRVLHVEDQPDFAGLVADTLEKQDDRFEIETASDASEGMDRLAEREYDAIVSDYDMPGRNGIQFLETVREEHPNLPFILYTGKGSEEVASEAISAGVTDYLQKAPDPSQYELLANRIENAVSQYRAERRADQTKRRMEELAEATHDVLYLFTSDWGDLLFVNSAYEDIWGRSIDELARNPRDFLNGVHPDDRGDVNVAMARVSNGESIDIEFRVNAEENYRRWVSAQAEPIYDENGEVVRIGGFVRDITERKRRETELERTKNLLEQAQHMADVTGWELDVSSYSPEFAVTDEFYRLHEFPADADLSLDRIVDQYHPEDRASIREGLQDAIATGDPFDMEVRLGAGEDIRWIRVLCEPVTDGGDVVRLRGSLQDITDRKRRETVLEETRERMELALEVTDAVVWDLDVDSGKLTYYPSSDPLHGESVETLEKFLSQVHPDDRPLVEEALETAYETGEYTAEFRVTDADDEVRWIHGEGRVEFDDDGTPTRAVGVGRDITERKERERKLERKNERLAEFAGVVSHDLQNPLQVAESRLEIVQNECTSEHLATIADAHDRMETLIDDLLTLAKEGASVEETQLVDLSVITERAWQAVTTGDATLVTDIDHRIRADPDRLQQLLENLTHNAVEHCDDSVTVTVGDFEAGFYVADDGPGIPEDEREQVLERGYSTAEAGTGFGLAIVQEIANAHGWTVTIAESEDGGARIEITDVEVETER